ncbi:MAG: ABC transporter permease subunit [Actinomycetota bacterium]|nr:ABC transporter permease subunit [Actinomycetota bacterium]
MRLYLVELTRLRSRRAVAVLLAAAFVAGALLLGGTLWSHRPINAADLAQAQQQVDQLTDSPRTQRQLERCQANPQRYGASDDPSECEQMVLPQVDWFLSRPQLDPVELSNNLPLGLALVAGVIAVLIGATFIGAEWSAGSVGTQLLYETRRSRVWLAKAAAVATVSAVLAFIFFTVVWTGVLVAHRSWIGEPLPPGFTGDLTWTGLRVTAFAAFAGLMAYAVTAALRHTVVIVGLMLAYSVIGEGLLREFVPSIERYLVSVNSFAWIDKAYAITVYPEASCFSRASCQPTQTRIELLDAAVYFGVIGAVVLLASLLVFHRRDVP